MDCLIFAYFNFLQKFSVGIILVVSLSFTKSCAIYGNALRCNFILVYPFYLSAKAMTFMASQKILRLAYLSSICLLIIHYKAAVPKLFATPINPDPQAYNNINKNFSPTNAHTDFVELYFY